MSMTTSARVAIEDTPAQRVPTGDAFDLAGKRIHFVGIGGCGMSGLARLALRRGAACTGTDMVGGDAIESLRRDGIGVTSEQSAATVPEDCEMLVASAAIRPDHPEMVEARRCGLPTVKYAEFLGRLMIGRRGIAIAGTHGKSTTTSLLSHVLIQCGQDPSFIVGAHCPQIGGGSGVGSSNLIVVEACEFDRSFHMLHPAHAVILNVEEDHLDMYSGIDEINESFAHFARLLPAAGSLLINHEMPNRQAITAGLDCTVETIGFVPQADWRVEVGGSPESGVQSPESADLGTRHSTLSRLYHDGAAVCEWPCALPGEHMAYNAAAAAVTAHRLGASWPRIGDAIGGFTGLERRMQYLGTHRIGRASIMVVDDYGHHPTEIDATLRALRCHYRPKRLVCVFQPHQHSRTRFLMEQFAESFSAADIVVVPHIYFVRDSEKERHAVRAADLVDRLRKGGRHAMHLYPFEAIVEQLKLICRNGDLLVSMGAGDVWKIARDFLKAN